MGSKTESSASGGVYPNVEGGKTYRNTFGEHQMMCRDKILSTYSHYKLI